MSAPFQVMGVVNVTPDSFSDGGDFLDAGAAVDHARELVAQGADILDVGGESTRPGAEPVAAAEELRRVTPALEGLAASDWPAGRAPRISIDTSKASVARAAIAAGASIVNDISALRADPAMVGLVAEWGVACCLVHTPGEARPPARAGGSRADAPWGGGRRYRDVVDDVKAFLEERLRFALAAGVAEENVMLDPGIGFGKTVAENLALLRRLDELVALGRPVVIGTSRKSFIGRILAGAAGETEPLPVPRRLPGTIATNVLALERGASVFRVHDVAAVRGALEIAAATLSARWTASAPTSPRS
jgi:dihydropteroate synthase